MSNQPAHRDAYVIRAVVSRWLRIRAEHEDLTWKPYDRGALTQLAADVDHSALLVRLLEGKEPLKEPPRKEYGYPVYPDENS